MRDAIKNAESGSAFITKAPVWGSALETLLFSTTKGSKVLCAIGIELALDISAFSSAACTKNFQMIDDFYVKIDNQLRMKSTNALALVEFADLVMDKVQSDTIIATTGPTDGQSYHLIPISGTGGRQCQLDIDLAAAATIGSFTEVSKKIVITPYYSDAPMPIWSYINGTTPATGITVYKLQVSGDFVGNGVLDMGILTGDGTVVMDDIRIIQEDSKMLLNQKYGPLRAYWQNSFQKTIQTYSCGFRVQSTLPWTINSTIEIDVTTSGAITYGLVFKNSSTAKAERLQGQIETPTPEPSLQPKPAMPTGGNTRLVGGTGGGSWGQQLKGAILGR
jgi:hypothetical protein